ncbi:hypothetical protein BN2497_201 [Janthinobacterium sp. CG23_2]|nr:hypothetical protein BN2497_201 [Janthinobacterium sp. CG23_2]CUU26498.1 hypothetical protein BN3177_201 [Janthinobacterium sp. CG23_2]
MKEQQAIREPSRSCKTRPSNAHFAISANNVRPAVRHVERYFIIVKWRFSESSAKKPGVDRPTEEQRADDGPHNCGQHHRADEYGKRQKRNQRRSQKPLQSNKWPAPP